jgi:hypothetical protein
MGPSCCAEHQVTGLPDKVQRLCQPAFGLFLQAIPRRAITPRPGIVSGKWSLFSRHAAAPGASPEAKPGVWHGT